MLVPVLLGKPLPHFIGGDADNVVLRRIVISRFVKDLYAKRALFEFVNGPPVQNVTDGIIQKMATPLAATEILALQDVCEPFQCDFPLFLGKGGHSLKLSFFAVQSRYS
jgi:hypothetical protein